MTVSTAIIRFIEVIIEKIGVEKDDNYEDLITIQDFAVYGISKLKDNQTFIAPLLQSFKNLQIDGEELDRDTTTFLNIESATIIDFAAIPEFKMRYRKFGFSNSYGSHLPIEFLHSEKYFEVTSSPFKKVDGEFQPADPYNALLDYIIKNTEAAEIDTIANYITDKKTNLSILVSKKADVGLINIYSYLFYEFLLTRNHTVLDDDHKYTRTYTAVAIEPNLTVDDFTQFFELSDVINEANFCPDILTRYLKFYHQLEYLAYRVELKKIAKNAIEGKSFITDIHKLVNSTQKGSEEIVFKDGMIKILGSRAQYFLDKYIAIDSAKRAQLNVLTQEKFDFTLATNDKDTFFKNLLKLIYRLRNCVVHNKESEFHLTITKLDIYPILKDILPWIINLIEVEVDQCLRRFDNSLKYEQNNIPLY